MGYSPDNLDLEEAKAIALGLGVPKFLIENLNVLPVGKVAQDGLVGNLPINFPQYSLPLHLLRKMI